MEDLQLLEMELELLKDNITRAKNYVQENSGQYVPSHSLVIGELKHRAVALKHRLTEIQKLNTYDLTRKGI